MGKTHGVEECEGRLSSLTAAIYASLPVAALASAKPIENEWKRRVQASFFKTGNYMRSIHSRIVERGSGGLELHIGTDIIDPPYPIFGEYGTSRMKARPTMTPAFEAKKMAAITEAEAVFHKVVTSLAP